MTQDIIFSGKGGVGKTTMAATTLVYQSGKGKPTLLVSTDPAGNLGDIFERKVGVEPIFVAPNLSVAQMDLAAHIGTGETLVTQDGIGFFVTSETLSKLAAVTIEYGAKGFRLTGFKKSSSSNL